MNQIKKGDIVGRKSYGKDVAFIVKNIIKTKNENIAILRGIIERVEADSPVEDLEKIDKKDIKDSLKKLDEKVDKKVAKIRQEEDSYKIGVIAKNNRNFEKIITGKVLHLDRRQTIHREILSILQKNRNQCSCKKHTRI